MTCICCSRPVLPHQAAHWTCPRCHAQMVVCFHEGPSGIDAPWALERHPGVPIYAQLATLRDGHTCVAPGP